MTRSEIFKAAHKMAKTFVGDYVACFALALKSIYKSIKEKFMKNPVSVDDLVTIGGKKWESSDKSKIRIYFGTAVIATAIGFEYTTYKTGNISSASLKGESLSNSKAKALLSSISNGKFWYDVISGEFVSDKLPSSHSEEIEAYIRESLKSVNINAIDK